MGDGGKLNPLFSSILADFPLRGEKSRPVMLALAASLAGETPCWQGKPSPTSWHQHSPTIPLGQPGTLLPLVLVGHPIPTTAGQESARSTYVPDVVSSSSHGQEKCPFFIWLVPTFSLPTGSRNHRMVEPKMALFPQK